MNEKIIQLLTQYVDSRAFPGAAYCFGDSENIEIGWVGRHEYRAESVAVCNRSWWDLASMTKVMATTMGALKAIEQGYFSLDDEVSRFLPESKLHGAKVKNLLLHDSGLKAYDSIAGKISNASEAKVRILTSEPVARPGEKSNYSCLGFINLMAIIERTTGTNLGDFVYNQVFKPLGIEAIFRPDPHISTLCTPTETTPAWRRELARMRGEEFTIGEFIQGSVHDPIAYVLGGLSGNAGLFAPIDSVARFGQALCKNHEIFSGKLSNWISKSERSTRALGFDTKSPTGSSAGSKFGSHSFGHTGYTGTCIWVDPEARVFAALLTNRVHPNDGDTQIFKARPEFFDAAFDAATS